VADRDINLVLKAKDAASASINRVRGNLGRLGDSASRGVTGGLRKAAGAITALAKAAAVAAVGGIVALTAIFTKATGKASDLNESLSKNQVIFGDHAKALVDWSKTTARSLGVSQNQALEATGTFGNLFRALKIGQQPAADMSKRLVTLASDLASFNNADPSDVLEALRAGLVGETEPLRKFGINLNDARLREEALRLGLVKTTKDVLPAAVKAQAAYSLILQDTALAQGDFARTSEGAANQQRILAAVWEDSLARLGAITLPFATMVLPLLVNGIERVATFVTDELVPAIQRWIAENRPLIEQVRTTLVGAMEAARNFIFNELVPRIREAITAIRDWVDENQPLITQIRDTIVVALRGFATGVKTVVDAILTLGPTPPIVAAVTVAVLALNAAIRANPIVAIVAAAITAIGLLRTAWEENWGDIRGTVVRVYFDVIEPIRQSFIRGWEKIQPVLRTIGRMFDLLAEGAQSWWNFLRPILGAAADLIITLKNRVLEILGTFGRLNAFVQSVVNNIYNGIVKLINVVQDLINRLKNLLDIDYSKVLGQLPMLPRLGVGLQHGGIAAAGRTYLVGEAGPELLTQFSSGGGLVTPLGGGSGGGGPVINVAITIPSMTPAAEAQRLERELGPIIRRIVRGTAPAGSIG
jgi:hypothetical protein